MLKARMTSGAYLLGIDAENVKRLQDRKPIVLNLSELGGEDNDVIIMYGDDIPDLIKQIEDATGVKMPPPTK